MTPLLAAALVALLIAATAALVFGPRMAAREPFCGALRAPVRWQNTQCSTCGPDVLDYRDFRQGYGGSGFACPEGSSASAMIRFVSRCA